MAFQCSGCQMHIESSRDDEHTPECPVLAAAKKAKDDS